MTEKPGVDPYNTADSLPCQPPVVAGLARCYRGDASGRVYRISSDGTYQMLDPRRDIRSHSAAGFGWGYGGSDPSQLAIAILADATGDAEFTRKYYGDFKWAVIAKFPHAEPFELTAFAVRLWAKQRLSNNATG